MKQFLKMIETVKRQRAIEFLGVDKDAIGCGHDTTPIITKETFFKDAEQCQPFVFMQSGDVMGLAEPHEQLDAPFKIFSIEMAEGHVCIPNPEDDIKIWIDCILSVEVKPKFYSHYLLMTMTDRSNYKVCFMPSDHITAIVQTLIDRMNREKVGVERTRQRIKLGVGREKRTHTIRKIIHIQPKKYEGTGEGLTGRQIDWSHRWMVRGHWRKHSGLGKDRGGQYCVDGFTWVSEHEKGPEDAPLINKVRSVD